MILLLLLTFRGMFLVHPQKELQFNLNVFGRLCKIIASGLLIFLALLLAYFMLTGLPKKAAQHSSVAHGCPTSWVVFMGMIYTLTYFTTDQYLPPIILVYSFILDIS